MQMLRDHEIGSGAVLRTFRLGDEQVRRGRPLTRAEIIGMPRANRGALVDKQFMAVFPPATNEAPGPDTSPPAPPAGAERHVVSLGFGRFTVIEGRRLTDKALTKDQAKALAAGDETVLAPPAPVAAN